ncbi:cell-cycle control medial ring component-domain-containing protein [Xylariomycetidae sp. FL0641]|nr:cell-cycle control medial ring component-domain-containing protein [Xylariomycetidae sp. FL0641]
MSEVTIVKEFLASSLDPCPVQLSPDYVKDPRTYQRDGYILPRMAKQMTKRDAASIAPGQERSLNVAVKSLRNPPLDIQLSSQTPNTSILEIKAAVSQESGIPSEKIKILHKKKPVAESKVLKDLVGAEETRVEFSVMIMGGAAAVPTIGQKEVAQGQSGNDVLDTAEFWDDLKGFLLQRVRDEETAVKLTETFQTAWKTKK